MDQKVANIMEEYNELSKKQRFGYFSKPISINLLNSYKKRKYDYRSQSLNKESQNLQKTKKTLNSIKPFITNKFTKFKQFSKPLYNTINDTYQDPGKLGKFNYKNNQFKTPICVKPWNNRKWEKKNFGFSEASKFEKKKGLDKLAFGFGNENFGSGGNLDRKNGLEKKRNNGFNFKEEENYCDESFFRKRGDFGEEKENGDFSGYRKNGKNSRTENVNKLRKRIFSVTTGKNNKFFSKTPFYPQNKFPRKKKNQKKLIKNDFKIGNNNYNKKNNYFENLKYALKSKNQKNKNSNTNFFQKNSNKKIWKPNNIKKTGLQSTFQPRPKYMPNGYVKQINKKKNINHIWKYFNKTN